MDLNKLCPHCLKEVEKINEVENCPHCEKNVKKISEVQHQLKPQTILAGKYLIGDVLGEGGFGITYVGFDLNLEMRVAIKEFYPNGYATREANATTALTVYSGQNQASVEKWRDSFIKEARSLAKCSHLSGVVGVKDFFQENNTAYIILEYLEGKTLKSYVKEQGGKVPVNMLLQALEPVIVSLGEVHKSGLIHRDISPDNIMLLPGGSMKLLDFGAARDYTESGEKSLSVMLKPGYAPEEQYRSKGVQGPWSDIYALCGTIYRCITGITPVESMERIRKDELKKPSELGIAIDSSVEAALMKGLAVFSEDRYQNIEEFHKALYVEADVSGNQTSAPVEDVSNNLSVAEEPHKSGNVPKNDVISNVDSGKITGTGKITPGQSETKKNIISDFPKVKKMKPVVIAVVGVAVCIVIGVIIINGSKDKDVEKGVAISDFTQRSEITEEDTKNSATTSTQEAGQEPTAEETDSKTQETVTDAKSKELLNTWYAEISNNYSVNTVDKQYNSPVSETLFNDGQRGLFEAKYELYNSDFNGKTLYKYGLRCINRKDFDKNGNPQNKYFYYEQSKDGVNCLFMVEYIGADSAYNFYYSPGTSSIVKTDYSNEDYYDTFLLVGVEDTVANKTTKYNVDLFQYKKTGTAQGVTDYNLLNMALELYAEADSLRRNCIFVCPGSSTSYIPDEYLNSLNSWELRIARNEIYARRGYIFTTDEMKNRFENMIWYPGHLTDNIPETAFNEYELYNRNKIVELEKAKEAENMGGDV